MELAGCRLALCAPALLHGGDCRWGLRAARGSVLRGGEGETSGTTGGVWRGAEPGCGQGGSAGQVGAGGCVTAVSGAAAVPSAVWCCGSSVTVCGQRFPPVPRRVLSVVQLGCCAAALGRLRERSTAGGAAAQSLQSSVPHVCHRTGPVVGFAIGGVAGCSSRQPRCAAPTRSRSQPVLQQP